jgi:hypothetical protein
MEKSEDEASI